MEENKINADKLWEVAWTYIRTVVDTVREPFLILDRDLRVISANKSFYTVFQVNEAETEQKLVYDLGNGQWNIPKLKTLLEDILPKNTFFENFEVSHDFPEIGHKIILLNARRIHTTHEAKQIMLLAMEDVTKQRQLELENQQYTQKLTVEVAKKTEELANRVSELERMNRTMVGRELKMVDLKKEIQDLKK